MGESMRNALIFAAVLISTTTSEAALPSYAYVEEQCRVMGRDLFTDSIVYSEWGPRYVADLTVRRLWFQHPYIRFRVQCKDVQYV